MPQGLWAWSLWVSTGLCLEVYGVWGNHRHNDTFSEWTGFITRANTTLGYGVLIAVMVGLLAWYPGHVRTLAERNALAEARSGNRVR